MAFWSENWKYANSNISGNNTTPSSEVMISIDPKNCKFFLLSKNILFTMVYSTILKNMYPRMVMPKMTSSKYSDEIIKVLAMKWLVYKKYSRA